MDRFLYREILQQRLFPFIAKKFNYRAILHQDNDSKHSSRICINALKDMNIPWVILNNDETIIKNYNLISKYVRPNPRLVLLI
jgi:hypothetical protein